MSRLKHSHWYKLRYPLIVLLFFGGFLLVSLVLTAIGSTVQAQSIEPQPTTTIISADVDSPNVVTSAGADAINQIGESLQNLQISTNNGLSSLGVMATQSRVFVLEQLSAGSLATVHGTARAANFVFQANLKAASIMLDLPARAIASVTNTSVARNVLRPSDHTETPIIDPNSPELKAALAALPPATQATATPNQGGGPVWPIHGKITTEFGVAHWPYQPTHTGIDISDGSRPGITPVRPFRPGRVVEVVHSNYSLGNHVIIDHGNGVTSVYGHLASTSVQVGQSVGLDTVIGLEGSTGASTGTHLHLEIRVNGQAANPHHFIGGQP